MTSEVWYEGGEVVVDEQFPSFEAKRAGMMWFVARRDKLVSGTVTVRVAGTPTFYTARAEADRIVLTERRSELWRQVEELKAQVSPDDSKEKTFRMAERMGDLLHRLTVLGTPQDKM